MKQTSKLMLDRIFEENLFSFLLGG